MNRLGVDFGGVITDRVNDSEDTSFFGDNFLNTTRTDGSFEALNNINQDAQFENGIWIVSKCGQRIQDRTEQWLEHTKFYAQTGIPRDHKRFTTTRPGKAPIARELGLTHFIDDKLEVLSYLIGIVPHLYLYRPQEEEVQQYKDALPHITRVDDWGRLGKIILGSESALQ